MQDSSKRFTRTEGPGHGSRSAPQSLRLRRASSQSSSRNYPQYDRSSDGTESEEDSDNEPTRDLRTIPLPMALKRAVRQSQQTQTPVDTSARSWKKKNNKILMKLKIGLKETLHFLTLWRKSLQQIGGNFGGGVQSYFLFLRFLVVINFFSSLLIAGFVIIPSIVFRSVEDTPFNSTGSEECKIYDPNPQGLVAFYNYFLDFLSGTGFIEYTYLFYGYYINPMVENVSYNIPLAYLLTAAFYLLFCLFCIIARMGTTARVAVATGVSTEGTYSKIVFTGWDYGSSGDQATKLKQQNIYYRLQVDLEEERIKKKAASLTQGQKACLYSTRIILFILAAGFIAAAVTGIVFATNFSQMNSDQEGVLGLFYEYLPSIVITAANFIVPMLNDQIAPFERYSPSITVILALFRAVFLRLVSLISVLFSLWRQITCDNDTEAADCEVCQYNVKIYQCWETRVGQEMYKLTLFDLLINLAVLVLVESPRRIVVDNWPNKLTQWVGRQEFVVPYNVLGLVYGQTVAWTGAFFCPLLPLINTLKFILLFYTKRMTLFQNCCPALKTFRSTTSSFFFSVILLLGLGLASMVMIYSVGEIHPSMGCGPFKTFDTMWRVTPTSISKLSQTTREFLFFIGSQAFSIPLFALSCVMLCYVISLAAVYKKSVTLLKTQLKLEGQDKQFLVKQIERLSRI